MNLERIFKVSFKTGAELDLIECYQFVRSTKCGAINLFAGTIRDTDIQTTPSLDRGGASNVPIKAIHYEAYEPMAKKQILKILRDVLGQTLDETTHRLEDENSRACVSIRLGRVPVGDASIIISVSSTSRQVSHRATMTILNSIKASVVIWKKIIYKDGSEQWDHEAKSEASWLTQIATNAPERN